MLEFLQEASRELQLAVARYEDQRPGLGAKFLQALRDTVRYAQDSPDWKPGYWRDRLIKLH